MGNNTKYNGLVDRSVLLTELGDYRNINDKIHRMIRSGELIQLRRRQYIYRAAYESGQLSVYQVANAMYGPSYVSFFSALEYHGMILECIETVESATILRSKNMHTPIGNFRYQKTGRNTFHLGIDYYRDENSSYLIASPTKALIDVLCTEDVSSIYGKKALLHYLIDDLRIEESYLEQFDKALIEQCIEFGKGKRILTLLLKLLEKSI